MTQSYRAFQMAASCNQSAAVRAVFFCFYKNNGHYLATMRRKMVMKKNYYAKVLALTVAASMVSVPAFAEEGDGTAVAAAVKNADTSLS